MNDKQGSEESLVFSYLSLRRTIGFLGTALPFVLFLGALIIFRAGLQSSMSSYYHTGMGDVLVGTMCVIGFFLYPPGLRGVVLSYPDLLFALPVHEDRSERRGHQEKASQEPYLPSLRLPNECVYRADDHLHRAAQQRGGALQQPASHLLAGSYRYCGFWNFLADEGRGHHEGCS